ncbi:carbohydrate ABC transporter permease [Curtobacterium flaccumfaciens]|jgi:raffinose/stachyose/melibiose transport system permease protein|uniref:carbohydrate ABC transporter permease n=1 Tax=Curtobacterium flaccumfaciens TaxID=2035 RepID=UPI000FFE85A0|nr:carbohydrate ABC transporter permease [Curtobacterium flaccumfaciens]MCS0644397.1 carbohydrate ABC transporter permease [Curtobacterium flaccumfaciens pv. flaccumfaciens]MCS6527124.1 carbohydrate ABC transporter permease [Curtobacterium flaccumfaciens pv. flaccumfaciens]MCS6531397.1 carbohydrate ABC transporter permease [Curtobacterium flaccumfaciens pv. flaccumfaciens]MCS6567358.1 carbohydrate ABC transporter permease [Curtobacterium flaccumfaciens pv. flaccumfaciens]MCS6585441.1 carbohydr
MTAIDTRPPTDTRAVTTGGGGRSGRGHRRRLGGTNWTLTVVLGLASLTVLVPLYVTLSMAFKTTEQSVDGNALSLPFPFNPGSFAEAWQLTRFPVSFSVSLGVAALTVVATLLLSSFASYAIVRNWHKRFFRYSFVYLLAAMFLPFPVVALPQIKLTAEIGLDNPIGVGILHAMFQLSFSVLLYSAYLRSIPVELEESARIDGASTWQIFWRIILPLLGPMNATVGIFAFLASWNDFMMPSLITADPGLQTLPVVQNIFQSQFGTNYNVAFASYLMAMAPTIIVYLFAQRWVISGVTQGAVKS